MDKVEIPRLTDEEVEDIALGHLPRECDPNFMYITLTESGETRVTFYGHCPISMLTDWLLRMGIPVSTELHDPDDDNEMDVTLTWDHQDLPEDMKERLERRQTVLLLGRMGFFQRGKHGR